MASNTNVLALEMGGTKLQLALGTAEGAILARKRGSVKVEDGAQGILEWFARAIPPLLEEAAGDYAAPKAIGVGFGGPVESATGRALVSHQVRGWDGILVRAWFEERFGLPTVVANDANAAGWAEYCLGAGRGTQTFCYMNIGSGIGGALVVGGKLLDGQGLGAAEIGHTYVPDWTSNAPGAANKLENVCSGWGIERRIRAWTDLAPDSPLAVLCGGDATALTCPMLADAARQGDARALEELDNVAKTVGLALSNVLTLVHPECIALGGGVSLMGDILIEPIRRHTAARVFGPFRDHYSIVPCALEEDVVVAGALLLAGEAG